MVNFSDGTTPDSRSVVNFIGAFLIVVMTRGCYWTLTKRGQENKGSWDIFSPLQIKNFPRSPWLLTKWKKGKHASNYLDIEPNCFTCKYFHAVFIYTELSRAETTTYIQGHTLPFALNSLVHRFRKLCQKQQLLSWYLSDQDVHCVQHCSYSRAHFTISLSACVGVLCAWREGGIMLGLSTTDPDSWRFFKVF